MDTVGWPSQAERAGIAGPLIKSAFGNNPNQPLVTIGAGALPLPTKQPAKLKEATTNASAKAVFFMTSPI